MKQAGVLVALASLLALSAFAQPSGPSGTGINASLLSMFGDIKTFSTKGEIHMLDRSGKESSSMPVTMAMLDGKLRVEMDMSQMKGGAIPPDAVAMLKQTGMDKMEMLMAPENKGTLVIYPGLQSYAVVSDDQIADKAKVETADVGKETVEGHPCVKRKLTVTDAKGKTEEAFVWAATDLKNFPIKMEMKQKNNTVLLTYAPPSFDKPDAKLFTTPSDYKKYDSIQGLMQAAMMRMFGGGK